MSIAILGLISIAQFRDKSRALPFAKKGDFEGGMHDWYETCIRKWDRFANEKVASL